MISKIGNNEVTFINKLIKFNCIFANSKEYCTEERWSGQRITYRTTIDNEDVYNLFLLWVQDRLIKMNYNTIEISDFLEKDMKNIVQKGINKKAVLDSHERNFSYFDVILYCLSIIGWISVPFLLYNHFKIRKYDKLTETLFKEINDNKLLVKNNNEKIFNIFNKYYELI